VADARLRSGVDFTIPALPTGERYRFVDLRTRAVVAKHAGSSGDAVTFLAEAQALAERLELMQELKSLATEREDFVIG
jgi:hypothetical protein